jgi:hypothetical protein
MRSTEGKEKAMKLLHLEDHAPALEGDANPVAHTIAQIRRPVWRKEMRYLDRRSACGFSKRPSFRQS